MTTPADRKAAIVTGAAGGIGTAEAAALIADGYVVVMNDINADLLAETARAIGTEESTILVPGDISLAATASELVSAATADGRRLTAVVNNAARLANGRIYELTEDDWDSVLAPTLRGTFMLSRAAAIHWRDLAISTGHPTDGTIINTISRAAIYGPPGQTNYAAAKAGVAVITQILARELAAFGVRCNAIAPRAYTPMMRDGLGAKFREDSLEEWSPAHIARFVRFLCGPGAVDFTGQVFIVHGPHVWLARSWTVTEEAAELDYSAGDNAVSVAVKELFGDDPTTIRPYLKDVFPLEDPAAASPFDVDEITTSGQ
jgi:NAD(P)-dependent dehydrogenase (short-subunit alcohol dehydrogenase family)